MNRRESAIISAYTGVSFGGGDLANAFHKYIEEKFDRPVLTHELAETLFWHELKRLCREDFLELAGKIED